MMKRLANKRHVFLLMLALVTAGCASTTLTNSWRSPDYSGTMTSLVVVGVSKQASVRRVFEDEFAAQLRSQGVRAMPSYTLVPEDGPIDKEILRSAVDSTNADAVIITRTTRPAAGNPVRSVLLRLLFARLGWLL